MNDKQSSVTHVSCVKYLFGKCHDRGEVALNVSLRDELTVD